MLQSIFELIEILDWRSRRRFIFLVFPITATTILELMSVALVLPVIQVVVMGKSDYPTVTEFFKYFSFFDDLSLSLAISVLFFLVFLLKGAVIVGTLYLISLYVNYTIAEYTKKIFEIYLCFPMSFHTKSNSGLLLRDLNICVLETMLAAKQAVMMLLDGLVMVTLICFLIYIEPEISIVLVLLLGGVGLLYHLIFSPLFRDWGERSLYLEGAKNKWILESFSGIRDVKVTDSVSYLVSKVYELSKKYAVVYSLTSSIIHVPRAVIESAIVGGFLFAVYFLSVEGYSREQAVTIIGLFGVSALRLMPTLNRFLTSASELRRLSPAIKNTYSTMLRSKLNDNGKNADNQSEEIQFNSLINIRGISHSYSARKRVAVKVEKISIKKGSTLALVGESGSGKSTLIDIILGLVKPKEGEVKVDGLEIQGNLPSWHKLIGFVPQNIFILDDSLRKNIAFGLPDDQIDDVQVRRVLNMSMLGHLEEELPNGLDTFLGEQGAILSGGQRQRVVIARSLYRNPQLLILDEAMSDLDYKTASEISKIIDSISGQITVISVVHDLSNIQMFDNILVLRAGSVVAEGKYEELIKNSVDFKKLTSSKT